MTEQTTKQTVLNSGLLQILFRIVADNKIFHILIYTEENDNFQNAYRHFYFQKYNSLLMLVNKSKCFRVTSFHAFSLFLFLDFCLTLAHYNILSRKVWLLLFQNSLWHISILFNPLIVFYLISNNYFIGKSK